MPENQNFWLFFCNYIQKGLIGYSGDYDYNAIEIALRIREIPKVQHKVIFTKCVIILDVVDCLRAEKLAKAKAKAKMNGK